MLCGILNSRLTVVVGVEDGVKVVLLPSPAATIREGEVLERITVLRIVVLGSYQHTVALMVECLLQREVVAHLCLELGGSCCHDLRCGGRGITIQIVCQIGEQIKIRVIQLLKLSRLVTVEVEVIVGIIERHQFVLLPVGHLSCCHERTNRRIDSRKCSGIGVTHSCAVHGGLRQLGYVRRAMVGEVIGRLPLALVAGENGCFLRGIVAAAHR